MTFLYINVLVLGILILHYSSYQIKYSTYKRLIRKIPGFSFYQKIFEFFSKNGIISLATTYNII